MRCRKESDKGLRCYARLSRTAGFIGLDCFACVLGRENNIDELSTENVARQNERPLQRSCVVAM